jgi:GTPase SAR1 family protein
MATKILIIGNSGTGKSTSIRNLPPDKTGVIRVVKKRLPFKESKFKVFDSDDYSTIKSTLQKSQASIIVIDDVQYLLANEFMRKASEKGFQKFTDLAYNFWDLLNTIDSLPDHKTVYLLSHLESDGGQEKFKTIGKLLDEKITVEGLFTIVLKSIVENGEHKFSTKNNGHDTTKSPIGLFETPTIDNDLAFVDKRIREYYEISDKPIQVTNSPKQDITQSE